MPTLENSRHESFAQAVASGLPAVEAYEKAGYSASSAKPNATRLMENEGIKSRIGELKTDTAAKCSMTRQEYTEYLVEILRTPIGKITSDHKLCHALKLTESGTEIKMPDKLRAGEQLAKLCGWNAPEELKLGASDSLLAFMESIRGNQAKQ